MKQIKLILVLAFTVILVLGCRTSKKIERFANLYKLSEIPQVKQVDNLTISFMPNDSLPGLNATAETFKNKDYLIILPFFTCHKRDYDCAMGANAFDYNLEENIERSVLKIMDSVYVDQLQNKYELKLNVTELYFNFKYFNKGGMVVPLVFYYVWKTEDCRDTELFLKLDYELFENGKKIDEGEIERKKVMESMTKYQEIPNFYNTDPNLSYRDNYSNHLNDVAQANLNGGIYMLIMEELKIGLGAFNDNMIELSEELITKKMAGKFK